MDETKLRYCFLVDWQDAHAQLTRRYQLFYYPFDHSIEMVTSRPDLSCGIVLLYFFQPLL